MLAANERSLRFTVPAAVHRYLIVLEVGTKMMYVSMNKGARKVNSLKMEAVVFFEKLDFSSGLTCLTIREYSIALIPCHSHIFYSYDERVIYKI
jgi:hypothetical protein